MKQCLAALLALAILPFAASAQDASTMPHVVAIDGNVWIAGQPDEASIEAWADAGVATVVNMRTDRENALVPFDEGAAMRENGMTYVTMETGYEAGYSPAMVTLLADILDSADGPVVLHCASGTRGANLYTAYRIERGELAPADAAAAHLAPHTELNPEIMRMLSPVYADAFPAEDE